MSTIQNRLTALEAVNSPTKGIAVCYLNPQPGGVERTPTTRAEIDAWKAKGYTVLVVVYDDWRLGSRGALPRTGLPQPNDEELQSGLTR